MKMKQIPSEEDIRAAYHQGVEAVALLFQKTFLDLTERIQNWKISWSKTATIAESRLQATAMKNPRPKVEESEAGKRAVDKRDMRGIP